MKKHKEYTLEKTDSAYVGSHYPSDVGWWLAKCQCGHKLYEGMYRPEAEELHKDHRVAVALGEE